MKKGRNVGFVYFLVFTFLLFCIFGGLRFYNGAVTSTTGSATYSFFDSVDFLYEAMDGVMNLLFEGVIKSIFGYALGGQEAAEYVLRAIIFGLLLIVINSVVSKDKNFGKYSWVISGLIAFAGAAFFPQSILAEGQALIGSIVVIGIMVGALICSHKWKLSAGWKSFIFFIVFFLILTFNSLIFKGKISDFGVGLGLNFYGTISSFSLVIAFLASVVYLIKAITGGVKEATGRDIVGSARRAREGLGKVKEAGKVLFGRRRGQEEGQEPQEEQTEEDGRKSVGLKHRLDSLNKLKEEIEKVALIGVTIALRNLNKSSLWNVIRMLDYLSKNMGWLGLENTFVSKRLLRQKAELYKVRRLLFEETEKVKDKGKVEDRTRQILKDIRGTLVYLLKEINKKLKKI